MSWQSYVDDRLVEGSGFFKATILSLADGGNWASTPGFTVSATEFAVIKEGFENPGTLFVNGLHINGIKFLVNKVEDGSFILAKYKAPSEENPINNPNPDNLETVMCMKSNLAIVVGAIDGTGTAGVARNGLETFVQQLKESNF
ncbi:hypothetical protein LPJ57_004104 [Coemansia sp. RSA 486]|nr:hypothetical protein LPJ57_004104 [Coemansia sp. RSA 486]KAJ2233285.1 hypothetical protein IWW45_004315 [Coemansia sp. RSA 485]KAJ2637889.1 hypothetical protein GGF40_002042 [Coemansia sp. RSA 1286]